MKLRIMSVAAVLLLALALVGIHRRHQATVPPSRPVTHGESVARQPSKPEMPPRVSLLAAPAAPSMALTANSPPANIVATNWLESLFAQAALPREVIDRWLASGRTNAEDLLAARAGGGGGFLRMALTNFPNDPRVLFAASALNDGPEAHRERLDRFKAAAPDNALADYLSARDHFKNAQPEQAVADLLTASGKAHFQDYTLDAMQNAEELYLQAGKSPAEAKALGSRGVVLPHLAQLKGLAQDMAALQRQYLAAGDTASAENLAWMGVQLGEQLSAGEGSRWFINQNVGRAVEQIVLDPLDPDRNYDFLQGTVRDYRAQLDSRRAGVKEKIEFANQWIQTASEADLISYFDRIKIYGEAGGMAWLQQRQGVR